MASGSWDKTVKVWDVAEALKPSKYLGNTINRHLEYRSKREIKTSQVVTSLRYSGNGQKIVTNSGLFAINNVISDVHGGGSTSLEDLWVNDLWLCYGNMCLLWLASDSEPRCYDTNGDQVAIGFSSGLVLVFDIDRRRLAIAQERAVWDI
jgi:WD40 repeat protein